MSFSCSSSPASGGRHRLGLVLAALFSTLASGCFNDPKIDPTQTRPCKDDKSCPWGSVCGTNGICCESTDGKTCKVPPPSGGLDATAIDSNPVDVAYDVSIRETGTGGAPGLDGSIDTGTGGMPGTGGTGVIDAPGADTVDAPLTGTGGILGTGGAGGTGGTTGSGGIGGFAGGAPGGGGGWPEGSRQGGAVATGGVVGTGGITGTGGATTCQPKARDCTSTLDNDCNGTPDNQETAYCACTVGQVRTCQEHPGYDGTGICKAGSQTCAASSDKTTSNWGACSGSVGPGTRNCTSSVDNDCNGTPDSQETTYCQCSAERLSHAFQRACARPAAILARPAATTPPPVGALVPDTPDLSLSIRTLMLDGYGNPAASCPSLSRNVGICQQRRRLRRHQPQLQARHFDLQHRDCKNQRALRWWRYPSPATMSSGLYQRCVQERWNHRCSRICLLHQLLRLFGGSRMSDGRSYRRLRHRERGLVGLHFCDGPNDCPGQVCVFLSSRALNQASCYATQPPNTGDAQYIQVCDPLASTCQPPLTCTKQGRYPLYACQ